VIGESGHRFPQTEGRRGKTRRRRRRLLSLCSGQDWPLARGGRRRVL